MGAVNEITAVVYGPDGKAYGSPSQARAAGVTNYTMSPPAATISINPNPSIPLFDSNGNRIYQKETWNQEDTPPPGQGWVANPGRNGGWTRDVNTFEDTLPQQLAAKYNLPLSQITPVLKDVGSGKSGQQTIGYYSHYDPATNIVTNYDPNGNLLESGQRMYSGGGLISGLLSPLGDIGNGLQDLNKKGQLMPLMLATAGGFAGLNSGIDLGAAAGGADATAAELATSAAQGGAGTSLGDIGSMAGTMGAGGTTAVVDPTIAAMGGSSAAVPAAGISANEAVAAGMSPGAAGATAAAANALTPAEAAAAAGTVGAGSALADVAAAGNAAALAAGTSGASSLLGGLSGTQLAALGTGAAGLYNASATRDAMQAGLGAQQAATAASQNTLNNIYNQQLGYQAPYQAAGVGAVNQLAGMNPYLTHQFNAADLQAGLAPNYDFMLQQGQQANQRAANVGGGALGGNALTGLNQYTQNYAGNAYQNAFNNYQNQRTGIYNSLAGIAGIGQTANTGAGAAGQAYSTGTVGLNTGLANATAASMLGQSQATSGGISNLANSAFLATLLGQK